MFKKFLSLFAALTLSAGLWAEGSVFTYTATQKLEFNFSKLGTVATHEFNDGNGRVTYNETVTTIIKSAFSSCTSLSSITLPEGVTTIGERAFYNCESLTSATLPEGLTTIGVYAFYGCGFTSITLPKGVTTIELYAFQECKSLQSITLPEGLTTIGQQAFYKTVLTSVTIPASVTTVGQWAFYGCTALASVTFLGNACQDAIGKNAFYDVGETTPATLVLPDNWTGSVPVDNKTPWYGGYFNYTAPAKTSVITYTAEEKLPETTSMYGNGLHTKAFCAADGTQLTFTHTFDQGVGTVTFDGELAIVGERAFYETGITAVTLPEGITTIGEKAFASTGLTSITLPESVTTIGESTFVNCSALATITIPASVTEIGVEAFCLCSALATITIPASVTEIGVNAFSFCSAMTSISVDAANTHYVSVDGVLFNAAKDTLIQYPLGNTRTEYTIPANVTTIGGSAFNGCKKLQSITLPESVTTIEMGAFMNCSALQSVTLSEGLTTIGINAFSNCSALQSITIPASVTTIGGYAFNYCSTLASVTFLGNACQDNIGESAFYNVGNPDPALLTLPDSWTGSKPDEEGNWYGGKFELSEDPTALPTLFGDGVKGNKFMHNGQVIIRKNGKTYNVVGQEVR